MEKVKVNFFLSKEVVEKLEEVYAKLLLKGEKVKKSHIVEEALREKLKELENSSLSQLLRSSSSQGDRKMCRR